MASSLIQKGRNVSLWFGRHQNWYLQIGIAGFIIAGIHLGADRIDDGCFHVLNFIDAAIDGLVAKMIGLLQSIGWISAERAQDWTYGFTDLVDVEARETASGWVAIFVELWVDFILGRAALRYREDPKLGSGLFDMIVELGGTLKGFAHRTKELVDVEFLVLPFSLVTGLIAATYVVFVVVCETFNQIFLSMLGVSSAGEVISTILAYVFSIMVLWSLGLRAITSTLRFAEKRAVHARGKIVRRTRGFLLLVTVLPVCLLGSLFGTPIGGLF